jgi:putative DNA primase/helicase
MNAPIDKMAAVEDFMSGTSGKALFLPEGFVLDGKGLWYRKSESDRPVKVADPFVVRGLARDPKGHGWGFFLTWVDHDGKPHQGVLPQANLIGEGSDVFRPLLSAGLRISPKTANMKLLKEFFFELTCDIRVRLVPQAGWYNNVFVLPTRTIGDTADEQVMFDGNADAARYGTAGTLQEWRDQVAGPCAGNTRAVFACSVALAGPLNDLLQGEGGGFHFVGSSSVGKTTLLTVAGSVFGGGGRTGFAHSWHGTENGIERMASRALPGPIPAPFWYWMKWGRPTAARSATPCICLSTVPVGHVQPATRNSRARRAGASCCCRPANSAWRTRLPRVGASPEQVSLHVWWTYPRTRVRTTARSRTQRA